MCEHGDTVNLRVLVPARLAVEGCDTWKAKPIDRCIAPIVDALNEAGIYTVASCCGHGKSLGTIVLDDGREILIRPYVSGGEAWRYRDPNLAAGVSPPSPSDEEIELVQAFANAPKLHRYGDGQWECLFCHEATTVANALSDHADDCLWRRAVEFDAARARVSASEPEATT